MSPSNGSVRQNNFVMVPITLKSHPNINQNKCCALTKFHEYAFEIFVEDY
jgi:hypothetical protein